MRYEERAPCAPLRPFVRCPWRLCGGAYEIDAQPIVPDGSVELVVHLGDPFVEHEGATRRVQPRALLAATFTRSIVVVPAGAVDVVGVRFRPGAAYPFLAVPAGETVDLALEADGVVASALRGALEDLEPLPTSELFDSLECSLLETVGRATIDVRFDGLVRELLRPDGQVSVAALARAAGVSTRHLERRFKERVGVAPKVLQRVVRFHRAVSRILEGELPLAHVAAEAGFFDQAHMNREFKLLAEMTPGRYVEEAGALDRLFAAR